jgi:lysozyme family protein
LICATFKAVIPTITKTLPGLPRAGFFMPKLSTIINRLISREGGFVNHAFDRGRATRYGISEKTARSAGYQGHMSELPLDLATEIYAREYWEGPGIDALAEICWPLAEYLFDYSVHSGPLVAIADLQRCLNALNRGGLDYDEIQEDGQLGPRTLAAADGHLKQRGSKLILNALASARICRFISIAESDPTQKAFLPGWVRRALSVISCNA